MLKIGVTLPQFRDEADSALATAREAERLGIDGVFCFDHLWPLGRPGQPALASAPLLGALVASTSTLTLGTLVARVGLLPDEELVAVLCGLSAISGGRFIAGLGTGDHLSAAENLAYGLSFEPAEQRRSRLLRVGSELADRGVPVWVGAGSPRTLALAGPLGAAVNLWEGEVGRVAELTAAGQEVTWGGLVGETPADATARLDGLARAGASWAVCAWTGTLDVVAAAADRLRSG